MPTPEDIHSSCGVACAQCKGLPALTATGVGRHEAPDIQVNYVHLLDMYNNQYESLTVFYSNFQHLPMLSKMHDQPGR